MSPKPKTLILFAHGAGKGSSSEWIQAWAKRLGALGAVVTFDYPYMAQGRKAPDRLPKLLAAHREALAAARAAHPKATRVLLAGKSMGSRVGCHLSNALEGDERVDGLICLGYPLKAPSKTAKVRDEVLLALDTPILFVQGTRDRLCDLDLLAEVRERLTTQHTLHVVESGDHSLTLTKTHTKQTGTTQDDADEAAFAAIKAWAAAL